MATDALVALVSGGHRLPNGTSQSCSVVPALGCPISQPPLYLQLPQPLQQLMAGVRLAEHRGVPVSRHLGHALRHRWLQGDRRQVGVPADP